MPGYYKLKRNILGERDRIIHRYFLKQGGLIVHWGSGYSMVILQWKLSEKSQTVWGRDQRNINGK